MAVFTKTKKRLQRPRCEDPSDSGKRCKLSALEYIDGRWRCFHHVAKLKTRTV